MSDTYTVDAWGNRQESGTFNFNQQFNGSNQINATGYGYDLAGNQTSDGAGNSYTYDADGKTSGSNGVVYTRDPLGQRIRKDFSGAATEYYYFGGTLLATHDASSGQWTDYIYAGNRLIAESPGSQTATPVYRIGDYLDSLAQKTDAAGNVLGANDFSPYGELVSSSAPDRLLFTRHERDTENSSDSTLYRQYASTQGSWLSPDPYNGSYNLADPQSLNRYAYLAGRPQVSTDPVGLFQNGLGDGGDGGGGWGGFLDVFWDIFSFFGGGGGPQRPTVSATVETTYGDPYDSNGTYTLPENVNVSYADVSGSGFGDQAIPQPAYTFQVYAFASAFASSAAPKSAVVQTPTPPVKKPSYSAFLGCYYNSVIQTITDEEDGRGWTAYGFMNAGAALAIKLKAYNPIGLIFAGSAALMDTGAMVKANVDCTKQAGY